MKFPCALACAIGVLFGTRPASAHVASLEAFGLSAHLGSSYAAAPRALDSNGVYVFNPGLGLEWDFRDRGTARGFSPIGKAAWLQDCNDRPLYAGLVGVRYWYVSSGGFLVGGSLSAGIGSGETWETGERATTFVVVPVFEIGHSIGSHYLARLGVVYVPPNGSMSATDNDGAFFYTVAVGHSVFSD